MIPKGCCCNCIQIYHPFPCSECHQKTQNLERYSIPKYIFPVSTSPLQGRHHGVPESWSRQALPQARGRGRAPRAIPRAEQAGQSRTKRTVLPQHPCSPAHVPALLPLGSSQMRVWWPGDPLQSRHREHPLSPLLLGNTNGHLFTPN